MRLLSRLTVTALLGIAALLLTVLPTSQAFASGLPASGNTHSPVAAGKTIDWSHPIHVQPTSARSGLSSAFAPGVVPEPVAVVSGQARPNANFPSNCYQGYGYYMGYQGQFIWTVTHGSVKAWVSYFWCPRFQGDSVGINWAYGRDYVLSGCKAMLIGDHTSSGMGWDGAAIYGTSAQANDGEKNVSYTICNGNYAWDDSLTVPGNGTYSVEMLLKDTSGDLFNAYSPVF